jgi:hypothetical protein
MATLPAPEELAKQMLEVIVRKHGVRANEVFMPQWLLLPFPRQADREAMTDYALAQGWVTADCKLTQAGFDAAP